MDTKKSTLTPGRGMISAVIGRLFAIPDRIPVKNRRVFSVGVYCTFLALSCHILFLALFGLFRIPIMFYYNIVSILAFIVALSLFWRESYVIAAFLEVLEFILHQSLAVISIGWGSGFQYLLITLVPLAFLALPFDRIRLSFILSGLCGLALLMMYLFLRPLEPLFLIPQSTVDFFAILNLVIGFIALVLGAYAFIFYVKKAEDKANFEFERAEGLLRNILPDQIAARLKENPASIADGFECVTVLFADIVDFTVMSEKMSPKEVVSLLNGLFSRFDTVAGRYGLEKIKTIGDAYMVASGIPERRDYTAGPVAEFALDIQDEIKSFNKERGTAVRMRIGINSGPVVAGVIGRKKFIYDLWGDAVNTASRMESHGLPDRIQVTKESYELLRDGYDFEDRGSIEVKGKGRINTYILLGRKTA